MTFAVVIPYFNDQDAVAAAVRSALNQGRTNEVIVVDDGSNEPISNVLKHFDDPRVRALSQANGGPSAARNAGVGAATSKFVVMLDADDELIPGALDEFAALHRTGADLVRTGALRLGTEGHRSTYMAEPSTHPFPRGAPLAGTFSISTRLFRSIDGYDEVLRYGENSELLFRAQRALQNRSEKVAFGTRPTVRVMQNPSHTTAHYRTRRLQAIDHVIQVHGEALDADRVTFSNYHAVAAHLHRLGGEYRESLRHAWAAARARPSSIRGWGRVLRYCSPR